MTDIEFLWWWVGGGVVRTVIFTSNPTSVLRLCCVVVGVVTIKILVFLYSANAGLLKNVQNHFSRFFGRQEISKTPCISEGQLGS